MDVYQPTDRTVTTKLNLTKTYTPNRSAIVSEANEIYIVRQACILPFTKLCFNPSQNINSILACIAIQLLCIGIFDELQRTQYSEILI